MKHTVPLSCPRASAVSKETQAAILLQEKKALSVSSCLHQPVSALNLQTSGSTAVDPHYWGKQEF